MLSALAEPPIGMSSDCSARGQGRVQNWRSGITDQQPCPAREPTTAGANCQLALLSHPCPHPCPLARTLAPCPHPCPLPLARTLAPLPPGTILGMLRVMIS